VFQNMLQAHQDIDSVFACSDLMALGAVEAIAAPAGAAGSKWSASTRSTMRRRRLPRGRWKRRRAVSREMGRVAVESAVKVMRGEKLPPGYQREARPGDQGQREMTRLAVGLIGLGRLGRVYARDLAGRIPETKLVAVADPAGSLAQEVAAEFDVQRHYADPSALIEMRPWTPCHRQPDAYASRAGGRGGVASETDILREAPGAVARRGRRRCRVASAPPGCSFRWASCGGSTPAMRRQKAHRGGTPSERRWCSSRRRATRTVPASRRHPKSSGGMLMTMGIHDFDSRTWFMGDVRAVVDHRATIAYPELATVGDIDNACRA